MRRMRLRLGLAALVFCAAATASAQAPPAVTPLDHLPALAGDYFAIDSREAGHRYHIYVRYPEGYTENPDRRYPVVYLLDGDSLYPVLAATQLFLHYDDGLPEALVVGVAYGSFDPPQNRRRHDYTNGAEAFGRFLEEELIPKVEARVRARPDRRILFGQSRGGGYVLHSAFTDPDLFWARIASNPTFDGLPALAGNPRPAARSDLRLIVASGSGDHPDLRQQALAWFDEWESRRDLPWALQTMTIEDGTHAADAARVYRRAMKGLLATPRAE